MRLRPLALAPALILAVAACSAGSSGATPATQAATASAARPSAGETIEVKLSDALRMEPAQMTVKAGQPVRFVVTNTGASNHEFYLGDEAAQGAHEQEMMSMGGMSRDEADGIVLKPGETKELTHTFATAGAFVAGCHETAHYGGGMKAAITVTG